MTENLKNFLQKVSGDEELREKLKGMQTKEEVIAFAGELGFALTGEDVAPPEGELNEDELAAMSGGGACLCIAAGGGGGTSESTGNDFACACPVTGIGKDGVHGDRICFCMLGGGGDADWSDVGI